jgi:hypothetical protein
MKIFGSASILLATGSGQDARTTILNIDELDFSQMI